MPVSDKCKNILETKLLEAVKEWAKLEDFHMNLQSVHVSVDFTYLSDDNHKFEYNFGGKV